MLSDPGEDIPVFEKDEEVDKEKIAKEKDSNSFIRNRRNSSNFCRSCSNNTIFENSVSLPYNIFDGNKSHFILFVCNN